MTGRRRRRRRRRLLRVFQPYFLDVFHHVKPVECVRLLYADDLWPAGDACDVPLLKREEIIFKWHSQNTLQHSNPADLCKKISASSGELKTDARNFILGIWQRRIDYLNTTELSPAGCFFPFDILLNRTSTVTSFRINEVSHVVVFHSCSVAASRPISLPRWKSINPSTFNSWLSTTTFTAASGILPASGRCRTFSLLSSLKYFLLLFPLKFYGRFDNRQLHKRSISLISFRPESSGRLCSNRPWRVMPS